MSCSNLLKEDFPLSSLFVHCSADILPLSPYFLLTDLPIPPAAGGFLAISLQALLLSRVGRGQACAAPVTDGTVGHFSSSSSPAIRGKLWEHNMPEVRATPSRSHPRFVQTPWQTMNSHNSTLTGLFFTESSWISEPDHRNAEASSHKPS